MRENVFCCDRYAGYLAGRTENCYGRRVQSPSMSLPQKSMMKRRSDLWIARLRCRRGGLRITNILPSCCFCLSVQQMDLKYYIFYVIVGMCRCIRRRSSFCASNDFLLFSLAFTILLVAAHELYPYICQYQSYTYTYSEFRFRLEMPNAMNRERCIEKRRCCCIRDRQESTYLCVHCVVVYQQTDREFGCLQCLN